MDFSDQKWLVECLIIVTNSQSCSLLQNSIDSYILILYILYFHFAAKALVIILLLVLMVLLMYAVVAFYFFNDFFHKSSENLRCNDMLACLISVIRLGSLSNPPLGDVRV